MSEVEASDIMTLRNCLFCDGRAELVNSLPSQADGYYYVKCVECGTSGNSFDEQEEAVTAWNTRVSDGSSTVVDEQKSESVLKMEKLLDDLSGLLSGFIFNGYDMTDHSATCTVASFGSLEVEVKCSLAQDFVAVRDVRQIINQQ